MWYYRPQTSEVEIAKLLIAASGPGGPARLDATDARGATALHLAVAPAVVENEKQWAAAAVLV